VEPLLKEVMQVAGILLQMQEESGDKEPPAGYSEE